MVNRIKCSGLIGLLIVASISTVFCLNRDNNMKEQSNNNYNNMTHSQYDGDELSGYNR